MTFNSRKTFLVLTLLTATVSALAAPPDMPGDDHAPAPMMAPGRDPLPPYLRGVSLTESQQDKIFELVYAQMPAMRTHAKEMREAREGLRKLSLAASFDEAKATALANSAARASAALDLARARTDYQILHLLTSEQRQQMEANRPPERDDMRQGRPHSR